MARCLRSWHAHTLLSKQTARRSRFACGARNKPAHDVLLVTTGGTIFQKYQESESKMVLATSLADLMQSLNLPPTFDTPLKSLEINARSGAELTFDTIFKIRNAVKDNPGSDGFVLVTGTDTMDEMAFILALLLNHQLASSQQPFVIMGAMKPADIIGYDGVANLKDSIMVACHPEAASMGVLLVMNDNIHLPAYVRKSDSQLMGSFRSHPGPIGQVRGGSPLFYYHPPLRIFQPQWDFSAVQLGDVKGGRVCIWTVTVSAFIPEGLLEDIDGLVIAGAGTGSLPNSMIDQLSPNWTSRIPIVITSRCETGSNYDDHYYRGSKERYTSRGFLLEGYEHLSAVQARALLVLQLAKYGAAEVAKGAVGS